MGDEMLARRRGDEIDLVVTHPPLRQLPERVLDELEGARMRRVEFVAIRIWRPVHQRQFTTRLPVSAFQQPLRMPFENVTGFGHVGGRNPHAQTQPIALAQLIGQPF